MQTAHVIHAEIQNVRACSRRQVYRYLKAAGVEPITRKIKPHPYPDNAAERVLRHLGLTGMPSMNQLRDLRRRAQEGRRAA